MQEDRSYLCARAEAMQMQLSLYFDGCPCGKDKTNSYRSAVFEAPIPWRHGIPRSVHNQQSFYRMCQMDRQTIVWAHSARLPTYGVSQRFQRARVQGVASGPRG